MAMPIIINENGQRTIMSGNTRADIAFMMGLDYIMAVEIKVNHRKYSLKQTDERCWLVGWMWKIA